MINKLSNISLIILVFFGAADLTICVKCKRFHDVQELVTIYRDDYLVKHYLAGRRHVLQPQKIMKREILF